MKTANGNIQRVFPFRLSPGEDVCRSLQQLCEENHILNGVMLTGIGSLDGAQVYDIQDIPGSVAGCGYGDPIVMKGLLELLSISGIVCEGVDGKPTLHLHCTLADNTGKTFGGHMIDGCIVKMTVEGCIADLGGVSMKRQLNPELGVMTMNPTTL